MATITNLTLHDSAFLVSLPSPAPYEKHRGQVLVHYDPPLGQPTARSELEWLDLKRRVHCIKMTCGLLHISDKECGVMIGADRGIMNMLFNAMLCFEYSCMICTKIEAQIDNRCPGRRVMTSECTDVLDYYCRSCASEPCLTYLAILTMRPKKWIVVYANALVQLEHPWLIIRGV